MIVDATGAKYRVVRTAQDGLGAARATAAAPVSTARGIVRTGGGAPDASAAPPGEN